MSDEQQKTEKRECNCLCHSEGFRKFIVTALGSFVGVFCAISLFAALHKPPMPCPCGCPCGCRMSAPIHRMDSFRPRDFHRDFKGHKRLPAEARHAAED